MPAETHREKPSLMIKIFILANENTSRLYIILHTLNHTKYGRIYIEKKKLN